jgi:hypothetical protein
VRTRLVIDLRQTDRVVLTLEEALGRFEKGGPLPVGARDVLTELADALARSSPGDAGLSADYWAVARKAAARGRESLRDDRPDVQCKEAERALRELRAIFSGEARSTRRRHASPNPRPAVVVFSLFLALCAIGNAVPVIVGAWPPRDLWPEVFLLSAFMTFCAPAFRRASDPDFLRSVATELAPNEPLMYTCRLDRGMLSRDQVLIATDRRLTVAKVGRRDAPSEVVWSVPYAEITSFAASGVPESSGRLVTLKAGSERLEISLESSSQEEALLAIWNRQRAR